MTTCEKCREVYGKLDRCPFDLRGCDYQKEPTRLETTNLDGPPGELKDGFHYIEYYPSKGEEHEH